MPYPAQISRAIIVETAWDMIATQGFEHLSLSKLAAALSVKAPSLYRHIENKAELLKAVNALTLTRLFDRVEAALGDDAPRAQLLRVGSAVWEFAQAHPTQYMLAMGTVEPDSRPDFDPENGVLDRIKAVLAEISGEEQALTALRGALALIHGFIILVLNDQLRRGGDLQAAFQRALEAYLDGWRAVHA